jgi:hypothetical protein
MHVCTLKDTHTRTKTHIDIRAHTPPAHALQDGSDLAEAIIKKCPSKIDIGPIYSHDPKDRQKWASKK